MRGRTSKRLRKIATILLKLAGGDPTEQYLQHRVTGQIVITGNRGVYKYAKKLWKKYKDVDRVGRELALIVMQSVAAQRAAEAGGQVGAPGDGGDTSRPERNPAIM